MVPLQACVNGARRPAEHPRLPVTAVDLADAVRDVVVAGASAVHLHVKDADGADTLGAGEVGEVLDAVRRAAPGVPVGTTTGAWAVRDPDARVRAVRSWTALPDVASVNWHEPGADAVAGALLGLGVEMEAGLWNEDAVEAWRGSPARDRCTQVLLELPDGLDSEATVIEADRLLDLVRTAVRDVPVLLHGEGISCWPALRHAARRGLATRIGLEDVLELPDGSPAPDNAALVRAARALLVSG